jgi:hypothetical protein
MGRDSTLSLCSSAQRNVRFGSKADIAAPPTNVRFTPKSGHRNSVCPLCANSGHGNGFRGEGISPHF